MRALLCGEAALARRELGLQPRPMLRRVGTRRVDLFVARPVPDVIEALPEELAAPGGVERGPCRALDLTVPPQPLTQGRQ